MAFFSLTYFLHYIFNSYIFFLGINGDARDDDDNDDDDHVDDVGIRDDVFRQRQRRRFAAQ